MTTAAYGNLRDDWDSDEPALSPSEVKSASFGELFSTKVTGAIYGQPLVINGTVIVTTERAFAYGINASTGAIEWSRSFGIPFDAQTIGCSDLTPYIGSTSTPVIEPKTDTVYLTTRLQTAGKGRSGVHWFLQAISAANGEEKPGFPVQISGTPVNTPGIPFNESFEQQRPGLLLLNGVVYMAFASDCDFTPYRGIVVGVNASSATITTMWSDESGVGTDESSQAGIWQSGGGLVSDIAGRIILTTGNGVSPTRAPANHPPDTLSESVIGLTVGSHGELTPSQFFAPSNAPTLDQNDSDLGAGGPIALPTQYFGTKAHPHLVVQVGKDGRIFLIDADNMGGYREGPGESNAVLQTVGPFGGVWGHPAAYGGQGGWIYVLESAGGGSLRALSYGLTGEGLPALTSVATSSESFGYTSGSPLVTSNGTTAGSAIVWVIYLKNPSGADGQLRAYAATPTGETLPLLWSHAIGFASKFSVPTAAEGRIYVGTRSNHLIAFGPTGSAPVQAAPVELGSVPVGASRTSTLPVSANQKVTVTEPVTSTGEQGASKPGEKGSEEAAEQNPNEEDETGAGEAPEQGASQPGSPSAPSSAGEAPATGEGSSGGKAPAKATAGPSTIPPSGNAPIAAGVITVQQPPVGTAIAAGSTLHLRVTFRPRHPGPVVGTLYIHTSAGTRAVTVSGYGTAPGIVLSAPPLAFGKIDTGAGGKSLSLTFTNSWSRPETLTGLKLPSGPYSVSGLPHVGSALAPRHAVTVSILFDPRRAGAYASRLAVSVDHRYTDIPVTGTAVTGFARLTVSAATIDAGQVAVGQSKTLTFAVANSGTVPLTISRAIAPFGPFTSAVALPEGITLDPRAHVDLKVTFRPTVPGPASGEYRFASATGHGYVIVKLIGTGV